MAKYVDKDGWIEEVEETNEWSNEIQEEDDEETIRLKKRLAKAEAELKDAKQGYLEPQNFSAYNIKNGERVSVKSRRNMGWLESLGYNKKAKTEKNIVDKYVKDSKTKIAIYTGIIIISIILIALSFVFV